MKIDGMLLEKINRVTAWLAFLLVGVFMVTGFGMVGMWGIDGIVGRARSAYWHNNAYMAYALVITLAVHGGICLYRRMKKSKII